DPQHPEGPVGGGADHRHGLRHDAAPHHPAAGGPHRGAAAFEHADLAGEGHVAGLDDPRHRAAAGRPAGRGADVRLLRAVRGGRGLLLGDLLRAVLRPDPAGDEAGEVRGEVTDLLTVRDVEKSFGELQVLRGISFDVPAGSVTAVIGPSGSGKTTMLRTLNALDRADTGVITIGDLTVDFSGEVDRATLTRFRLQSGMVFQNHNLFP